MDQRQDAQQIQTDGTLNYCYKISPRERAFALRLEQAEPGTEAACIAVSVVVSENSCGDDEPPNSYSCYFAKLRALTDRQGIGMRKRQLPQYECFAENKQIPPDHDVSDCENVFQRREAAGPEEAHRMLMADADKLKRDIDGLRESIRLDWHDLASKPLPIGDRAALRRGIAELTSELCGLIGRLDAQP